MCSLISRLLARWVAIGVLFCPGLLLGCTADGSTDRAGPPRTLSELAQTSGRPDSQVTRDAVVAAEQVAKALNISGYAADFSIDSLREVDRFFDEHSANGEAVPDGLLAENTGGRLFALGAYTGEVLRRNLGGEWRGDDDDPMAEINIELWFSENAKVWPVQRVIKRFTNGAEDSMYHYGRYFEDYVKAQ